MINDDVPSASVLFSCELKNGQIREHLKLHAYIKPAVMFEKNKTKTKDEVREAVHEEEVYETVQEEEVYEAVHEEEVYEAVYKEEVHEAVYEEEVHEAVHVSTDSAAQITCTRLCTTVEKEVSV
ncbi:hypothetical protein Btru_022156 [Bulinus truncatus]|nr:hypothetical protein Btru_022156 [Bulinus truncatus]